MSSSLLLISNIAFAQRQDSTVSLEKVANEISNNAAQNGGSALGILLNQIMFIVIGVAIVLAIFAIVRGGFEYMTSSDSDDKKSRAKNRIQAAFGGLLLAVSSILILNTINTGITSFDISFPGLQGVVLPPELQDAPSGGNFLNPDGTYTGEYFAQIFNINNGSSLNASADGSIVLNGNTYYFRSGGGGRGYLPEGSYTVSNGRLRNDVSSMQVDGYGYSFDLSDAYDSRVGGTRTLLRIHPDGGNAGTAGCIGIQGGAAEQRQFYKDLTDTIAASGGTYTIRVGK